MTSRRSERPMRIALSEERRERLAARIQRFFDDEFEHELSDFQAQRLVDFLLRQLGAPVYNQAVQDARAFFQARLDDLDGELHEPEDPES